jgi:Na+/H+-translocating membrane pyrophosphatase
MILCLTCRFLSSYLLASEQRCSQQEPTQQITISCTRDCECILLVLIACDNTQHSISFICTNVVSCLLGIAGLSLCPRETQAAKACEGDLAKAAIVRFE